jgi:HD-GYP domain-containing protein (c-di-GMP phosphodiesterase class II)/DNA-binding CsgD family transcriptional regulator
MAGDDLRLAEPLAALSLTTDLAMGQEIEKALRTCLMATRLARAMDLPEAEVRDIYYTALLQHLGCTATNHEETYLFGDELSGRAQAERTDIGNTRETLALMATVGRGTGLGRVRHLARTVSAGREANRTIFRAICEVGARMAERLHLGEAVRTGLFHSIERWDGKGEPQGLSGEDISLLARVTQVATQAVIFDRLGGPEAAVEMVRRRSEGWFDPKVVEVCERIGSQVLGRLAEADVWSDVLEAEPEPVRQIPEAELDDVARAFADMVDLKTPFTLGHSSGVAELAEQAAGKLRLSVGDITAIRRAALFHDLGRVAVSNITWEKAGTLTATQWEQVRIHPYHTERILARSAALRPLARPAGMHHDRQDGSGYHHGASGGEIPIHSRLIAAADAFQAMTQDRPHRAPLPVESAAEAVMTDATDGRLDLECVRAVLEAAGHHTREVRTTWPGGLSDREVQVVRLVARGLSNKEIAARLFISPRTAEHHVQHVYAKIGVSTRAAAALYAMEHDLLGR